jgi:hypothetical protein
MESLELVFLRVVLLLESFQSSKSCNRAPNTLCLVLGVELGLAHLDKLLDVRDFISYHSESLPKTRIQVNYLLSFFISSFEAFNPVVAALKIGLTDIFDLTINFIVDLINFFLDYLSLLNILILLSLGGFDGLDHVLDFLASFFYLFI